MCYHFFFSDPAYLIPLICSLFGLVAGVALVLIVMWHRKRQHIIDQWKRAAEFTNEKANNDNIENFQNLRRYRNPLYEKDKGPGTSNIRPIEILDPDKYHELDSDCHDRSPTRLLWQEDFMDAGNDWLPNVPEKTKIKDINIELNKSRLRPHRRDFVQIVPDLDHDETEVIV